MMNNLQSSAQVANKLLTVLQRYTKGIRFVAFLLVLFTVNIGTASAEKSIDFESGTATYSDWTFTNMTSQQSGSITAKGGSYYGTTGGKSTASIQTKNQISSPKSISCYVSKQSNNTTSSTWYIQTSTNGSSWTNVKMQSATSMSKGSWVEFTADLSSYSNVYVRIYYSGSTAVRNIDNLVLTEGTTTSYDVNWMVNGENYTTGSPSTSVSEGSQVTILPTPPTLDCGGKMFVGWSNQEVTDGSELDVLFTTAENSPAITEPTTFHAVFATKGSNQTATFDAATISGLTKSSSSLTWTHNTSGIELYLSAGQRYTSGTPNTFTVTSGTSNYCQLSAPTGIVMSKVVATLSGTNYKINSVSTPWTLSTSSTIQTISSTNGSDYLKMSATSSYQIRITQLVVTYATYSDYTTTCTTETLVTLHPNGGTISDVNGDWDLVDGLYKQTTTESNIVLPTITKGNWTFAGWDKDADGVKDYEATETITLNGTDVELSALWECTPLPAPTGINATPNNDGAIIYWNKVTDATGYEVSIDEGNTWNTASAGDNPSYTVTGIECGGTTISYLVRATGDASQGYCEKGTSSESHSFTTTDCDCPNTYSFHYKNNSDWNTDINICFSPVDGATNNYLTDELYLPYSQYYKVGWQGQDQWYSVETEFSSNMPFFHNRNNNGDRKFGANPQQGNLGGGKGRFHVYHDSNDNNKYISFIPTGYTLNFGSGDEWSNDQTLYFTPKTSNWDEKEWYTDLVTLTNDQINKQIFVGLQTEVDYVWCEPYSEKLNIAGMRTKTGSGDNWVDGGMNTSYTNKTGKFRIYADSGDKNWYVTFVPHYQLKYDANGGTGTMNPMPAEPVSCEDTETNRTFTVAANTFTRDNYNFTGWNTKADGTGQAYAVNNVIVLTGDVTLYAQWEQQSCPAYSFHTGGSDVWNTREEDHCFVQKGSTSEWRIDNYIRPNHTHYVVNWQGGKYTNGGSQNATFASRSWNNMPFANVRSATVGQSAYGVKGSLRIYDDSNQENLYISFIPDAYVLKFGTTEYAITQHSGNDYRSEIVEYAASASANYSVSVGVADADGHYVATNHTQEMRHIFLDVSKQLNNGKWTDASAKFAIYYWNSSTNGWSSFMKEVPGETNLYEAWIPSSYTNLKFVRLNSNAGTPNWDSKWNETGNLTIATSNNLFTITDWGAGTWSAYSSKGKFRMHDDSGDKNWYVHFYPHYVLTYDKNHADANATGSMEQQSVPKDASSKAITIAECEFARIGYDFVAWNANMNGQGTSYNPGDTYTLNADKTLYAKWAPQQYEIIYKDQGNVAFSGENTTSLPATHTYGTATAIPDGVKTGYTFGGWYDNPDCTGTPIDQLGATDYTSDITLYAKWTANTNTAYTVEHYQQNILDDNYTLYEAVNFTGTTATSVTPAVKDYIGFTAPSTQTVTIAADGSTVVEYKYTRNSYILTWILAGGEITKAGTTAGSVKFGATLMAPTVTKSGLTFIGWSPEVPATMPAEDITYTAIWENCIWIETDIANILPEDEVVITMLKDGHLYALDHSNGDTNYPPATEIFVSGNKIESVVGDAIQWNITGDATNGYTIYPNGTTDTWLFCSKSYVRVGDNPNKVFTIENGYLKRTNLEEFWAKYIGVSISTSSWRHYDNTTGVIANQTLKFYKRVCLPEGQYWVKWMVNGQEYTEGNPTTMVTDGQITAIPDNPANDAIGDCADTFMGWSESNLGSAEGQPAPTDLFTTLDEAQELTITENKTFYAVFATAEAGQSSTESIFSEDFSSISKGDNTTTGGSGNSWDKNDNFYSVSNVFQAGGAVRLGKSDEVGYLVTKQLTAAIGETLTISFTVKGWSSVEGNIQVSGNNSEFTQPSAISYTSTMSGSFETKSVSVVLTKANPYIKIATTGKRAFIDDIQITKTTSPAPTYSNYVTNCCALAPATNLTVSGTTANSATLTWTAPTSTTGITKLQVRDGSGNVVVDNLAANTTSATISGLTECTSYQYYVVSVGDCEVFSNTVTATPFSGAKTVNYDYNGGSGSPASFTTNCTNQTITLPVATRTGYTFNGWYTAATGGTRVGGANDTYEPATSPVTLYAQWTINQYTVTWNPNGGNWNGSTSNIVQTYEYGAAINKPDDPTRENGIFKGWSPEPTSTMPADNKTYTAQWEMVYALTFVDMNAGGTTTTLTQTSSGQNLVAPTANSEVCDMWTFIGWAPSNSLNGGTDKPTGFIAAGETIPGSQITGNKTYYSVYSYNSDNTQEFEVGKSGTYLMYALSGTTKYYATTANSSGNAFYTNQENNFATYGYPSTFTLTYNSASKKYKIYHENTTEGKNSKGYLYQSNATDSEINVKSETSYTEFTISEGTAEGSFVISFPRTGKTDAYFGGSSSSNFSGKASSYDIYFEPASEIQYYNAANCGEVETYTMSFHNPFGDENALIWYDAEHEDSYYTDKPLNTSIDVFPTMVYNGWAFIGWTANQQYNELIGEDNLDDENSATNDPASLFTIYSNTAGWAYTLNSNVTMYPVFTKFEDNEPFDMVNGGDYYIYYIADGDVATSEDEYGATNRIYAGGWGSGGTSNSYGATQSCASATLFTFTKLSNGKWSIYDNTKGRYLCAGTTDNNLALNTTTATYGEWTITVYNGNQVNAVSRDGYTLSAYSQDAVTGTFKNYATSNFNNNSKYYHRVYVGTCTERVYSSNPTNKPAITLSGEPIVTSTQDQSIRAQGELSISATKLAANGTITLTSDNADVYFSSVKDANFTQATKPVASLPLMADEKGKLATTTVYVHYKPTSTSNLGVQTANITATTGTEGEEDYATAETTAHVRNLSAKFVIATKVGAIWYALPADMTTASNPLGVVIEVDENNMTATAPNSCTYTLFPVKTTNTEYDRYEEYGDRLRFSAVNNSYKGLWANNSKTDLTINNDMVIDQASDGQTGSDLANNSYYEWKVTTTVVDGHWQYTLQTDQTQNQNYLRYWTSAEGTPVGPKWGTYNAGENKLYFLPVTETQPFEYAVVEWYPTKMLIQTDAAITSPTVKVGGEEIASPELTIKGGKLYEISNLPLETNPNKLLQVSFTADAVNYVNAKVVPIILSRGAKSITGEPFAALTQKVYQYADVVVRDGATLTIDGGTDVANTLLGMTIYPTAKVAVDEGYKLSVHNLTFFGGIDEIYDGSAYTINKYGVPQLSLKGILNKTITTMDYIMRVNLDQMYQVGVPYDVNLSDITYWDGTTMTLGDNLYVSAYDGQKRANREEKSWVWETDFTEKVLKAGIGYTISADKQDAAHEYSIIRMPMKNNITSGNTETAKTVQVYAYDNTKGVEITDNHKGWNYLSNPYMVAISGAEADSKLVVGYLRETGTGPWEWVDDTYRYVTIPSDDGKWYDQQQFEKATLLPFKSFFLQIATSGELSFALASRQGAPARYLQSSNEQREVEFEVLLANDTRSDNLGFLIGEDYTPAYEINADLEKMIGSMSVYTIYNGYNLAYNALSPTNAAEQIPIGYVVPTVGEYTFALDESSDIEDVEHIYLIDYETSAITDLVTDVYTFTTLEQKSDTRFAINVALKSKDNTATGLDNMNTNGELPTKFIYQDKMYILHHGVIYDATGKRVITINK